jgi:hypothetical protein
MLCIFTHTHTHTHSMRCYMKFASLDRHDTKWTQWLVTQHTEIKMSAMGKTSKRVKKQVRGLVLPWASSWVGPAPDSTPRPDECCPLPAVHDSSTGNSAHHNTHTGLCRQHPTLFGPTCTTRTHSNVNVLHSLMLYQKCPPLSHALSKNNRLGIFFFFLVMC